MLFSVLVGSKPIFSRSDLSAQEAFSRAVFSSREISFFSFAFSASSHSSCRRRFSSQVEQLPFCTSMSARLMDST